MAITQYVALLRGINVGGKNLIKMTELRACFEAHGLTNVATYIQSGNVLFEAEAANPAELEQRVEQALLNTFHFKVPVVLRSHQHMRDSVERAPQGFGQQPDTYRYDVIFLKRPLTAAEVLKNISLKEGVDQVWNSEGVLYFSRLASRATASHISRIVSMPMYQNMTIRNWNTTTKLLALMDARVSA